MTQLPDSRINKHINTAAMNIPIPSSPPHSLYPNPHDHRHNELPSQAHYCRPLYARSGRRYCIQLHIFLQMCRLSPISKPRHDAFWLTSFIRFLRTPAGLLRRHGQLLAIPWMEGFCLLNFQRRFARRMERGRIRIW